MVKRFSTRLFVIVTVLHIFGTILLIDAGFAALRAEKQAMETGQPEPSFAGLEVWGWIWQPIAKFVIYYDQHHPHPVRVNADILKDGWGPRETLCYLMLPWSVFVGICFGFFAPYLSRRRHRIA